MVPRLQTAGCDISPGAADLCLRAPVAILALLSSSDQAAFFQGLFEDPWQGTLLVCRGFVGTNELYRGCIRIVLYMGHKRQWD